MVSHILCLVPSPLHHSAWKQVGVVSPSMRPPAVSPMVRGAPQPAPTGSPNGSGSTSSSVTGPQVLICHLLWRDCSAAALCGSSVPGPQVLLPHAVVRLLASQPQPSAASKGDCFSTARIHRGTLKAPSSK